MPPKKPATHRKFVKRSGDVGRILRSMLGIAILTTGIWLHYVKGGEVVPVILIVLGAGLFDSKMIVDLVKAKFGGNGGSSNEGI